MNTSATQNPTAATPDLLAEQTDFARQVLQSEAAAVAAVQVGPAFHQAVELILAATAAPSRGSLVVSGLGKAGLVGQKLSATFASTGTPSHFLHATEAMHGDLGRVRAQDVVLLLSYSGETDEIVALASLLRQDEVKAIAISGRADCQLGRVASCVLAVGDITEACPHNLAPTASTTAMMALGDALALCVSRRRDFGVKDFQKFHPGGALGRQLMPVTQAMRFRVGNNLPLVPADVTVGEAYQQAQSQSHGERLTGALLIVDESGSLAGIFTDADLRRLVMRGAEAALRQPIRDVMTAKPRCVADSAVVRDVVQLVRELRIDEVPVVDPARKPVGLIDVQDLVALRVIEGA